MMLCCAKLCSCPKIHGYWVLFMLHTLMIKMGPTALTSYAYSKDDFCTLVNVVSDKDHHKITFGVGSQKFRLACC